MPSQTFRVPAGVWSFEKRNPLCPFANATTVRMPRRSSAKLVAVPRGEEADHVDDVLRDAGPLRGRKAPEKLQALRE